MNTTAEQEFPGCDGLFGSGDESTLVNPMLQPVEVYRGVFLCISGWLMLVDERMGI
jgi:hypothetical protein